MTVKTSLGNITANKGTLNDLSMILSNYSEVGTLFAQRSRKAASEIYDALEECGYYKDTINAMKEAGII